MAEVTTSGKVIQKPELVLEVDDFLPPGLIGVRNKTSDEGRTEEVIAGSEANGTLAEESTGPINPGGTGDGTLMEMPIPLDLRIISQTIRVGPDGKMVVDVVIETSNITGVSEFETRIILDGPVT